MYQTITARLYLLFALALLGLAWKVCHTAADQLAKAQATQAAQIERILSENN